MKNKKKAKKPKILTQEELEKLSNYDLLTLFGKIRTILGKRDLKV